MDYHDYVEPNYPLTRTEFFDEDNMKYLLGDTRFAKQDRKRLTDYNKHRQSGGQVLVQYKLAKGCEEFQLGRLFPTDGLGLQSFRFDIRNPLTKKNYWDIDMENAHYCIAERWCDKYDLPHAKLTYYINNRDACLKMVSDNRKKAKTEFLKILYGGNIKLYNEMYEEADGEIKPEGLKFLNELKPQIQALMDKVWEQHVHLQKIKVGADKTPMNKKPNYKASLMSLLFQTDERKILMFVEYLMKQKYNRTMGIFIHDGGNVERKDSGETEFPKDIITDISTIATSKFKTKIVLTQKPIDHDWSPLKPKLTEYETRKVEFEKRNFFVGSQFIHVQEDGLIEFVKSNDMNLRLRNNHYMEYNADTDKYVKKYFFQEWLEDPDRASFERIDFIPDVSKCPPNVFNLFKGFNAEKYRPATPLNKIEIALLIKPIIQHLEYLTSGYALWVCRWFAKKIQQPLHKNEVSILFRDMGGLLTEGGGTGKNLLLEWIGNEIFGEDSFYVVSDNRELYGTFNSQFEAKLLIMVEEASGKDNHLNHDMLKAKITAKKQNVNKKGVQQYSVRDLADYLFCSNNRNPLPNKQGNRRFAVVDTNPIMRGCEWYFTQLANHLANPLTKWAFFQFLSTTPTYDTAIQLSNSIPITPAYTEVRVLNAPLYLKWILCEVRGGILADGSVRSLYERFKEWVKCNKEGATDNLISETAFGILLNKSKEAGEEEDSGIHLGWKTRNNGSKFKWNVDSIIDGLQKLHLLEKGFKYHKFIAPTCADDVETDTD